MDDMFGAFGMVIGFLFILVAIMWMIVPFLIAGVNKRLDTLNKNVIKIGKILKEKDDETVD